MSVTKKETSSSIRQAGNTIAAPNFTSIWDRSAILNNRQKPAPALFSRKNLNFQYHTEAAWKGSIDNSNLGSPGHSPRDTLQSINRHTYMGGTETTFNGEARATSGSRFPTKQGKKF